MTSSGKLRRVALVRTDVSEELSAPSSPILVTLIKEALNSSETSVLQEPRGVTSQKTPFYISLFGILSSGESACFMRVSSLTYGP
jgi:hypothetical protein